jgi:DNA gyrase subunit B
MYIGDRGTRGLHNTLYELVYNAINEAEAGFCTSVAVELLPDGGCRVRDDGRGIPWDFGTEHSRSAFQRLFTEVGTWRPPALPRYRVATGLWGIGLKSVTALSERTEAEVRRGGKVWRQEFRRGEAHGELTAVGDTAQTGTSIAFWPDPEIFRGERRFNFDSLAQRLHEFAAFHPGLAIRLTEHRREGPPRSELFRLPNGTADYVRHLNRERPSVHADVLHFRSGEAEGRVEVALQWTSAPGEWILCFANDTLTSYGGPHREGFRQALTRAVRSLARYVGAPAEGPATLLGEDCRAGLTAVIAVWLSEPQFGGATKERLGSPEARPLVQRPLFRRLIDFLRQRPDDADTILAHILAARHARLARPRRGRR